MTKKSSTKALCWIKRDLRLKDHPALTQAMHHHEEVIIVYNHNCHARPLGAASKVWLFHSLNALAQDLREVGSHLNIYHDENEAVLKRVIKEHNITDIYTNTSYVPEELKEDIRLQKLFKKEDITLHLYNGQLLAAPSEIKNKSGEFFKVYTPFSKAFEKHYEEVKPLKAFNAKGSKCRDSLSVDDLKLLPKRSWHKEMINGWKPGEKGAHQRIEHFCKNGLSLYSSKRDFPCIEATSKISPHLSFGEITPRSIMQHVNKYVENHPSDHKNAKKYFSEIVWREFSYHILFHFPQLSKKPFREEFASFKWKNSPSSLKKWQEGMTGFPLVDAAMRQLYQTGWMHNRLRMVVGSFLVKDLQIDWKKGEAWFWDTLVDADVANNPFGWQWIAGCGADGAPFFRIYNPVTQSEKFDSDGEFIQKYVPELKNLATEYIHAPWIAPEEELEKAGIELGVTYPYPMLDHREAREEALKAFDFVKKSK